MQMWVHAPASAAAHHMAAANRVRGEIYNRVCVRGLGLCVCNTHAVTVKDLFYFSLNRCMSVWSFPLSYLIFVEGASHPVPQGAEFPLHLSAFLRLLRTVLLFFVPCGRRIQFFSH